MKRYFIVLVLTLLLPIVSVGQGNSQEYLVDFISTKQGLSHNYVTSIVSDDLNVKWIGTENGITKFDGFNFDYIKPNKAYDGLLNENIEVLFTDRNFNLWIGTKSGGLSFFDKKNNIVKNFNHLIDLDKVGDMRITSLSQDHSGHIWIGTWNKGVFVIDPEKELLTRSFPSNNTIYSIACDFHGNMWFSSGNTLHRHEALDQKNTSFETSGTITDLLPDLKRKKLWIAFGSKKTKLFSYDFQYGTIDSVETNVPSQFTRKLSLDQHSRLWIGTWGKGVYCSNDSLTIFNKIELNKAGQKKVNGNYETIIDVHHDKNNITWLATANAGIIKLLKGKGFSNADQLINNSKIAESLNCNAIYKNKEELFIGSTLSGVFHGKSFTDLKKLETIDNIKINVLYEHSRKLYIGTAQGFQIYDLNKNKVIYKSKQWVNKVTSFHIEDQTLFIGTQQLGLAIVNLNELDSENSYTWYAEGASNPNKIESNRITEIKKDNTGNLWISTYNGIHLYQHSKKQFIHQTELLDSDLPSVIINSMLIIDEFIWLATPNGLIKLKSQNYKLTIEDIITQENGINSDFICAVTSDQDANIWFSTTTEIVKYDETNQSIISFGEIDGINTSSFNNKSLFNYNNEVILFGGNDNITTFNPRGIRENNTTPEIIFTHLRVNNELINYSLDHPVLNKNFQYANEINLTHRQNFFAISFVANDFLGNLNIHYRYMLDGFHEDWIYLQNRNEINFTGLAPGGYTLQIQASRNNQDWSETKAFDINLSPSPWLSPLAFLLYTILVFGILYFFVRSYLDQLKLKNNLAIAKIDTEKEKEIAEAKLKFFTNISHEFRTPLTLISGPVNELLQNEALPQNAFKHLNYIEKNTNRLLNLTNQLLDFRKAEHGLLKLDVTQDNFVQFAHEVFLYFKESAESKNISYEFTTDEDQILLPYDSGKMEIVICNLLSNAIKYTDAGGSIIMKISKLSDHCIMTIQDTGMGMNPVDTDKIFNRFVQIKSSNTAQLIGSGIGLAFSKEIIQLHHGTITVDSELDKGTSFTVQLATSAQENQLQNFTHNRPKPNNNIYNTTLESHIADDTSTKTQEYSILAIDDNHEIRSFLELILKEEYHVLQAENGDTGIDVALKEIPDLIICDVMMPGKDGITVCRELKSHIKTSHIPIILLTARTATVYEVEGLQTGADDYITKPFNARSILARIKSLLDNREKIRAYLLNQVRFEPTIKVIDDKISPEDAFIQKAMLLVEENIDDSSFGIETMVRELHMSQSTLYRKIKSLTGLSLTAFVRSVRLKKAAEYIATTDLKLNQIAYTVGFNDYKYFKSSFKKQFGCVPSKFMEEHTAIKK